MMLREQVVFRVGFGRRFECDVQLCGVAEYAASRGGGFGRGRGSRVLGRGESLGSNFGGWGVLVCLTYMSISEIGVDPHTRIVLRWFQVSETARSQHVGHRCHFDTLVTFGPTKCGETTCFRIVHFFLGATVPDETKTLARTQMVDARTHIYVLGRTGCRHEMESD